MDNLTKSTEQLWNKLIKDIYENFNENNIPNIKKKVLRDKTMNHMNFHRFLLENKKILDTNFYKCCLRGVFIEQSSFVGCYFYKCSFITALIGKSNFLNCKFEKCAFIGSSIHNTTFDQCEFTSCFFDEDSFDDSQLIDMVERDNYTCYINLETGYTYWQCGLSL